MAKRPERRGCARVELDDLRYVGVRRRRRCHRAAGRARGENACERGSVFVSRRAGADAHQLHARAARRQTLGQRNRDGSLAGQGLS